MTPETGRRAPNPLIDQLAEDLAPVRTLKLRHGLALVTLALVATVLAVAAKAPAPRPSASIFTLSVPGPCPLLGPQT